MFTPYLASTDFKCKLKKFNYQCKIIQEYSRLESILLHFKNWEILRALLPVFGTKFYLSPDWQVPLRMIVCIWVSTLALRRDNRLLSLHSKHWKNGFKESFFLDSTSNVWISWGQCLKVEAPSGAALWGSWAKQDAWVSDFEHVFWACVVSIGLCTLTTITDPKGQDFCLTLLVYSCIPRICSRLCP